MYPLKPQITEKGGMKSSTVLHILLILFYLAQHLAVFAEDNTRSQISVPAIATTYSTNLETTINGTIRQFVKGTNGPEITIDGPQGPVEVNLGNVLSRSAQQSLAEGQQIQITGISQNVDGVQSMQARLITLNGQQITLRNKYGFSIHERTGSRLVIKQNESNGGTL
jgi:hypothetical protein